MVIHTTTTVIPETPILILDKLQEETHPLTSIIIITGLLPVTTIQVNAYTLPRGM